MGFLNLWWHTCEDQQKNDEHLWTSAKPGGIYDPLVFSPVMIPATMGMFFCTFWRVGILFTYLFLGFICPGPGPGTYSWVSLTFFCIFLPETIIFKSSWARRWAFVCFPPCTCKRFHFKGRCVYIIFYGSNAYWQSIKAVPFTIVRLKLLLTVHQSSPLIEA